MVTIQRSGQRSFFSKIFFLRNHHILAFKLLTAICIYVCCIMLSGAADHLQGVTLSENRCRSIDVGRRVIRYVIGVVLDINDRFMYDMYVILF